MATLAVLGAGSGTHNTHGGERHRAPKTERYPAIGACTVLSGSTPSLPTRQAEAALVLETRAARTSFVRPTLLSDSSG